jgi:hypothetical protein
MKVQFMKTRGEYGSFAILTPQVFLSASAYGPGLYRRTLVGEFTLLEFDFIECKAMPFGEAFAFAGTARELHDLCAHAIDALRILCDPRFVVCPPQGAGEMNAITERDVRTQTDFRHLSYQGEPIRVWEAEVGSWPFYRTDCEAVDKLIAGEKLAA